MSKIPKKNEEITAKEVRVIGPNGEMLGVMTVREGIAKAKLHGLDLLEISPNVTPPVCKVLSFGKYKYDAKKKESDTKQKQHKVVQKEVKVTPNIGENDYQTKMKRILSFLEQGHRVIVMMQIKGRERSSPEKAVSVIAKIEQELEQHATIVSPRATSSGTITVTFAPKKK